MKKILLVTVSLMTLNLVSCVETPNPNDSVTINKHGSIDMSVSTKHLDSTDILISTANIYTKDGVLVKTIKWIDTIPTLGMTKDTFSLDRTTDNGDEIDTVINHKKDYQLYITVK